MPFAQNVLGCGWCSASRAVIARSVQLFFLRDVQTGLVWATKILTDPFHDVKLYRHAPAQLLRGELWEQPAESRGASTRSDRPSGVVEQPRRQHLEQDLPPDAGIGERRLVATTSRPRASPARRRRSRR